MQCQYRLSQFSADPSRAENQLITSMCISPSEETLVCATDQHQLYCMPLSSADIGKQGDSATFEVLSQSFHSGSISGKVLNHL